MLILCLITKQNIMIVCNRSASGRNARTTKNNTGKAGETILPRIHLADFARSHRPMIFIFAELLHDHSFKYPAISSIL